ncbi:MAG: putative glycoside hydrolase [Opitutales bacterium]
MKRTILTLLGLMTAATFADAAPAKKIQPKFSWDTVQVCIHLAKDTDDFTEEEAKFIARFPMVCLEKSQGRKKHKGLEKGAPAAAQQIKKYNKDIVALFYFNSRIDYGHLYLDKGLFAGGNNKELAMTDAKGNLVEVRGNKTYDLSNPKTRSWWLSQANKFSNYDGMDGIFIDATIQFMANQAAQEKKNGEAKQKAVVAGLKEMMGTYYKENPTKYVIANAVRSIPKALPDLGVGLYEYLDGSMMEHFATKSCADKDAIVSDIALIADAAKRGKSIVVKAWPDFTESKFAHTLEGKTKEQASKEQIVFPLAAFLAGAGEKAYFCYSWWYGHDEGGLIDYPEYSKPLGKPLGDAVKNGYVYTRKFQHADIWVDVENRKAKINWKK